MWFVSERSFSYHVVELAIAEMACVSRNVCRTFHVPFLLFQILRTVKDFPTFHFWARCLTSLELNSALSVRPRILVVEFVFAEIASTSQTIRTSSLTMIAVVWSSGRFLTAKTHILFLVELAIAEMACVSRNIRRTFHVPSGVSVQRSISERDCSHPV